MTKRSYKTVLLGDASVGKSSFAVRLTKGDFSDNTNSTIGAAFFTYLVRIDTKSDNNNNHHTLSSHLDGIKGNIIRGESINSDDSSISSLMTIKFDIWDTAGQERFKSIAPIYYRGAACAIVILDISSPPTLQHAAFWVNQLRVANSNDTIIILVANKIDLLGTNPETIQTLANAKAYAKEQSISFVETSAKTGQNVSHVFELLAQAISKDPYKWDKKNTSKALNEDNNQKNNTSITKKCCSSSLF